MIAHETRSRLLFETLATKSDQDIRTGRCVSYASPMVVRIEGWTCYMSKGGLLCETVTCTLRGGPTCMLLLDAIHGIFGPILKLSRLITLHLYNDSVPSLESRCRVGYRFFFSLSFSTYSFPTPGNLVWNGSESFQNDEICKKVTSKQRLNIYWNSNSWAKYIYIYIYI